MPLGIGLPKVEGFSPLPSSVSAGFMVAQTAAMMRIGGMNWAAGQRLVKAMSNETFNNWIKGGMKDVDTAGRIFTKQIFQEFLKTKEDMMGVNQYILQEMVKMEHLKVAANVELIKTLPPEYFNLINAASLDTILDFRESIGLPREGIATSVTETTAKEGSDLTKIIDTIAGAISPPAQAQEPEKKLEFKYQGSSPNYHNYTADGKPPKNIQTYTFKGTEKQLKAKIDSMVHSFETHQRNGQSNNKALKLSKVIAWNILQLRNAAYNVLGKYI